jgi:hypothetical protein
MPWDRLLRRRRREADADEADTVDLDGEEHAWWAAREELDNAYAPRKKKQEQPPPSRSTFSEYFSTESLFSWTRADEPKDSPPEDGGAHLDVEHPDPYEVLGLPEDATWKQIVAAHRRLAKQHHPDRLGSASAEQRHRSDRRMRQLNIAYSELRRRRGM